MNGFCPICSSPMIYRIDDLERNLVIVICGDCCERFAVSRAELDAKGQEWLFVEWRRSCRLDLKGRLKDEASG